MTTLRAKILDKVIADLRGTCQSLEEVAEYWQTGEFSIEDLQYIESEIFLCDGCGWWCELCEQHDTYWGGHVCDDCYSESDEEEDE